MARITHVKKAQVRYPTRPVTDPATGEPKRVPVTSKRTGEQKTTRRSGKPVFMTVTERVPGAGPLPNHTCDFCRGEILPGTAYKHISPRSGPYGGRTRYRHGNCPNWQVWEYSSSLSAQLARISYEYENALTQADDPDQVRAALEDAAGQVRDLAGEKQEAAQNIEDGFGHSTSISEALADTAEQLESWASEIEAADVPEFPEGEEPEEEDAAEQWREEVAGQLSGLLDDSPV